MNKENIEEAQVIEKKTDAEIIGELTLPFKPIDERILVKPLPAIKLTKTHEKIDEAATAKAKKKQSNGAPELILKTVTEEVDANLNIGVILAIGDSEHPRPDTYTAQYKVGDKIVYVHKAAMPFELLKDSVLLRRFEILGLWLKATEVKK